MIAIIIFDIKPIDNIAANKTPGLLVSIMSARTILTQRTFKKNLALALKRGLPRQSFDLTGHHWRHPPN
jgi:hypothetical protein